MVILDVNVVLGEEQVDVYGWGGMRLRIKNLMESFWIVEMLKYYYFIFFELDFISLDDYVFNIEVYLLKIFKLGKGVEGKEGLDMEKEV